MVSGVHRNNYDCATLDNLFKGMKVKPSVKTNGKFSARVGVKNPTNPFYISQDVHCTMHSIQPSWFSTLYRTEKIHVDLSRE